ncbi:MAG: YfhO family protein [Blastocatellia bacterium]|nr:YfhO family protein [Blastocatellia bacterium]
MSINNSHEVRWNSKRLDWLGLAVACTAVLLTIAHTVSTSSIVHFRDLAHYSLPFSRWMRRTIASGHLPLWNAESGLGFSAISDPTLQLLFPPTVLLRLLLPETLGLNLSVSLAIPVAFAGALLLFRRRSEFLAALGGATFYALCGPILSAANMLNLGWSAALAPWVVLAALRTADTSETSRVSVLALAVALQSLAGEPITFAATVVTAAVIAVATATSDRPGILGRVAVGVGIGVALACIQLIPLVEASVASARGGGLVLDAWSLHPATLLEALIGGLYGSPLGPASESPAWYRALNGGRDPLVLSIFVGLPALSIGAAALGDPDSCRRIVSCLWLSALVVAIVLALGDYTPILPFLREHVPGGTMARFPSKFVCLAALAIAALVCNGVETLRSGPAYRASRLLALGVSALGLVLSAGAISVGVAGSSSSTIALFASMAGISRSESVVGELADRLLTGGGVLLAYSAITALIVFAISRYESPDRLRMAGLAALAVVPLLISAPPRLIPTIDRSALADPEWIGSTTGNGRVFVSAEDSLAYSPDVAKSYRGPDGVSRAAAGSIYGAAFPVYATGLGISDALTTDLALLRPQAYSLLIGRYEAASVTERRRALSRLGVSDIIVPFEPQPPDVALMQRLERLPAMAHWRIADSAPRFRIVHHAVRRALFDDQLSSFFSPSSDPATQVLLELSADDQPDPASAPSAEAESESLVVQSESTAPDYADDSIVVVGESPSTLVLQATCGRDGGWLVVNDAWAKGWIATVDGLEVPVERANGVVRAVRLNSGSQVVKMSYRPRSLTIGSVVTCVAIAITIAGLFLGRGRRSNLQEQVT